MRESQLSARFMHARPVGTEITIAVTENDDTVGIALTDTGPGIPQSALDNIFERFYRADSSRSRRSGGSGLGRAIVKAIVSAHGGTATAANLPGEGAQIGIELPRWQG